MNICLKLRILRSTIRKIKFHLPKLTFHFMKRLYLYLYIATNFLIHYNINHTIKRILLENSRVQNEETTKNFHFILKIYPKLHRFHNSSPPFTRPYRYQLFRSLEKKHLQKFHPPLIPSIRRNYPDLDRETCARRRRGGGAVFIFSL